MISLNWIKDYVDISDQDLKELAVKITKAGVNVEKVNTLNYDAKTKRMGRSIGKTASYKKAVVKLTADSKEIEFFQGM